MPAQSYLCSVQTPSASAQALGELANKTLVLSVGTMRPEGRGQAPGHLQSTWRWVGGSGLGLTLAPPHSREIGKTNRALLPWLLSQRHKHNKACCPLEGIMPSPQQVRPTDLHPMPLKKLSSPIPPPTLH